MNTDNKIVEDYLLIQVSINNWMIVSVIDFINFDLEMSVFVLNGIYSGLRNFTFAFEYSRIQVAHSKFFALASYARKLAPLYRKIP